MISVHSVASIRCVEAEAVAKAPTDALMVKAARGVADAAKDLLPSGRVAALVGGGDNGGDALYATSYLAEEGYSVRAIILSSHPHARALEAAKTAGVEIVDASDRPKDAPHLARPARLWIDGLVGTGAEDALREPLASVVAALEAERTQAPRRVVAVDVHSGVATPDGSIPGPALRADIVVTMGAVKPSLVFPPACYLHREVRLVDLGLQMGPGIAHVLEACDVREAVLQPGATDHKYTRGVVRLVAGSEKYPGAAVLSAIAAEAAGAGMVRMQTTQTPRLLTLGSAPGVVMGDGRAQAIAIGPGMDPGDPEALARIDAGLAEARDGAVPVIVDAGATRVCAQMIRRGTEFKSDIIMTPHAGEAASALSALDETQWSRERVEEAPMRAAIRLAGLARVIVVLKGAATLVVSPRGHAYVVAEAPGWAGVAGSGDVLAGVIATFAAAYQARVEAGADPNIEALTKAVASGVWVHATAAARAARMRLSRPAEAPSNIVLAPGYGLRGGMPIAASNITEFVPRVIGEII